MSILTTDEITESFCITDDFCKEFSKAMEKVPRLPEPGKRHRNRPCEMSDSEIITILMLYHFGSFKNFKRFLPALYLCSFTERLSQSAVM
jgi:hypothetical protein